MGKRYTFLLKNWLLFGLAFALYFPFKLQAQNGPAILWDKSLGGSGSDGLTSLQQTTGGGFILGGVSGSPISGDKSQPSFLNSADYWIVKTNASGNKIWDKTFGTVGSDALNSIIQTADGGYLLGGYSNHGIGGDKSSFSNGDFDYWIIKVDGNGNKVWDKSFGGNSIDQLQSIQQTSDGGYIIGGMSLSGLGADKTQPNLGTWDYWIVKTDASGNKLWDKSFGGSGFDGLHVIKQTSDGGYILGGHSDSPVSGDKTQASKGSFDYWVIKLDGSGSKLWDKTIGGNWDDGLYALQQTTDGGFILGGTSSSPISGDKSQAHLGSSDYWIVKLNALGDKLWDKTFGGTGQEQFTSIHQTTDGGYLLGGYSYSGIGGDKSEAALGFLGDYWVVKISSVGIKQWDKTLGGSDGESLRSLTQTSDGGYLLGGYSDSGINGNKSAASKGSTDFWIVKLAPDILGVKEPSINDAISILPNPSKGKFKIQFNNLLASKAEVTVSDLLGRMVFQQEFKTTNHHLSEEINLPNAKGIYLLQFKAGNQLTSRKIVVE